MAGKKTEVKPSKETKETKKQSDLNDFVIKEKTTMAEIRWPFKTAMSHHSCNSSSNLKLLFKVMFPDSEICKILLSSSKMSYLICHGLEPHFCQELLSCLEKCDFLVVSFDEAFNEVSKKGQMDLVSRYWAENTNRVAVRYLN